MGQDEEGNAMSGYTEIALLQYENETAEACAKVYLNTYDLTDIADDIRSGKWREYL